VAVASAVLVVAVAAGATVSVGSPAMSTTSVTAVRATGTMDGRLADRRPNLVVIMADDMRADDLRWMPSVRRLLVQRGASFANSFAPYPLCCPSRASFLTGQYAHNHHVLSNVAPYGFHSFDDSSTVATDLSAAGYRTGLVGKYLNGYGRDAPPGSASGTDSTRYVPPGWTQWRGAPTVVQGDFAGSVYDYRNTTVNWNEQLVSLRGQYNTTAFGDMSVRLINRWAPLDSPFFLYTSYLAPHFGRPAEPDDPPRIQSDVPRMLSRTPAVTGQVRNRFDSVITKPRGRTERDVGDKAAWFAEMPIPLPGQVAAMVESARQRAEALTLLDQQVARTVQALQGAGELDRTVIVFTSDNGFFEGEHRLQADKTLPYEPALRVPLVIRGAGIPDGVVRRDPAMTIDLAPTLDALAAAAPTRVVDGRSILNVARHGDEGWDRPVITATGPLSSLERWNVDALALADVPFDDRERFVLGLRVKSFAYFTWATGETELYDMRTDPGQLDSVADDPVYAPAKARLETLLADVRDCSGVGCTTP
jgi:N-acetylglucosamine-6-sulfatase